ncbi:hypothetical protein ACHAWF_003057 [Thalassiosira exigua]
MAMTADEFVSEGNSSAELDESAELDLGQAQSSLDRAIWCFLQAGNLELAAKARTHRLSLQFRLDVLSASPDHKGETEVTVAEMKGAQLMKSLAKEGLTFEVLKTFYSIEPFFSPYTKEELERLFISKMCLIGH